MLPGFTVGVIDGFSGWRYLALLRLRWLLESAFRILLLHGNVGHYMKINSRNCRHKWRHRNGTVKWCYAGCQRQYID